jgi:hypothetical protein
MGACLLLPAGVALADISPDAQLQATVYFLGIPVHSGKGPL